MITQMNTLRKKSVFVLAASMLFFSLSATPMIAQSESNETEQDEYRTGSCFFDGKPTCRVKRTGTECLHYYDCEIFMAIIRAFS